MGNSDKCSTCNGSGKHIEPKEILKDKDGVVIKEGDFLKVNPMDDDWLDIVIFYENKLMFAREVNKDFNSVALRDVLQDSDNPAIIIGNIHTSRIEFGEY